MDTLNNTEAKDNELLFCSSSEISASFLARNFFDENEFRVLLTTSESSLMQIMESKFQDNPNHIFKRINISGTALLEAPIFFDDPNWMSTRKAIENLFLFGENLEYSDAKIVRGVIQAVVRYLRLRKDEVTVRNVCDTVKLFFDKPLGDEDEYANRLDEVLESYGTGIHVDGGERSLVPGCPCDEDLRRYWEPVRGYFDNEQESARLALRLRAAIEPYDDVKSDINCINDEVSSLFFGNGTLVVEIDPFDRLRDGLIVAFLDQLIHASSKVATPGIRTGAITRIIVEDAENLPTFSNLASYIRNSDITGVRFSVHFSSFSSFSEKYVSHVNETMASFDAIAFLSPIDPGAFHEINSRIGISFRDFYKNSQDFGWLIKRGECVHRISWKHADDLKQYEADSTRKGN